MGMWLPFQVLENIGTISFTTYIVFGLFITNLVFLAKDFKIWSILSFVGYGALFLWFYEAGYNWIQPLVLMFMFLVITTLSVLPASFNKPVGGGFI